MIPPGPADRDAIEAPLRTEPTAAMFSLANLATYGFDDDHPNAMRVRGDSSPPRRAVLGLTDRGMALPFRTDAEAAAAILRRQPLRGFLGRSATVRPPMRAHGLEGRPATLDADEPQFRLAPGAMTIPAGAGRLAPLDGHAAQVTHWRQACNTELHSGPATVEAATAEVEDWTRADSHRVPVIDGAPVALTDFDAILPGVVQVGGGSVPPEGRNRELARRAVALHPGEARGAGVREATLFASSEAAASCYRALGFARIGTFALVIHDGAQTA